MNYCKETKNGSKYGLQKRLVLSPREEGAVRRNPFLFPKGPSMNIQGEGNTKVPEAAWKSLFLRSLDA